mmetsp:Transcript_90473/g.260674  ORF Transcript_90473/g.260674 Transcript_90473/m.260674 type:complete len:214 (+) Transcript_90473:569-1210(+)
MRGRGRVALEAGHGLFRRRFRGGLRGERGGSEQPSGLASGSWQEPSGRGVVPAGVAGLRALRRQRASFDCGGFERRRRSLGGRRPGRRGAALVGEGVGVARARVRDEASEHVVFMRECSLCCGIVGRLQGRRRVTGPSHRRFCHDRRAQCLPLGGIGGARRPRVVAKAGLGSGGGADLFAPCRGESWFRGCRRRRRSAVRRVGGGRCRCGVRH